jgi:hypothetical protein
MWKLYLIVTGNGDKEKNVPKSQNRLFGTMGKNGGDGGNRTRVRKTRPTEIYERSRSRMSPQVTQPANLTCSQPFEPESPLSRSQRRRCAAFRHCDAHIHHRTEFGMGGRGLARRPAVYSLLLTQRGAWRHRKCGWHLIVCTDFSSSVPLGSHSGTSLFRRSLSSPDPGVVPQGIIL